MPTYIFLGKVKEFILPKKEYFTNLLKQMYTKSKINLILSYFKDCAIFRIFL
jgi:hypothetical protein